MGGKAMGGRLGKLREGIREGSVAEASLQHAAQASFSAEPVPAVVREKNVGDEPAASSVMKDELVHPGVARIPSVRWISSSFTPLAQLYA